VTVFAIVASRAAPRSFRSRAGGRLRVVRERSIAAVVNDRAGSSSPTTRTLRRYDHLMQELADRFPAILPVRFGTQMAEDELRSILSSRRTTLGRALAHVRNRAQMTVRVVRRNSDLEREVPDPTPRLPPEGGSYRRLTGRDYLRSRARAGAERRAVPGFEPVRDAVARWVRDERVEHRAGVSSVYHLIPRSSAAAYRHAAQTSAASSGITAIVSGPWPPYAFAAFE
jgi:hypothetical protein